MTEQISFTDIFHRRDEKYRAHGSTDHHDNRVLYRTRKAGDKNTLYLHVGDHVMQKAGLKAGDRVRILQADHMPRTLALKKHAHGIKLTPKSMSGDDYHAAMGTVCTCMLQLVIKPSDRLPYTTSGDSVPTEWNVQEKLLIMELDKDDVSIRHLLDDDETETKPTNQ